MASPAKKTLTGKLAEIMGVVSTIPKRGTNKFHGYDYATEADIAAAVRQELATRSVILIPSVTKETRTVVGQTAKGREITLTALEMTFTFMDGDSEAQLVMPWMGWGVDESDKGGYKAMTGAEKYFLLKTFLMPTGDDPEHQTVSDDDVTAAPTTANVKRPPKTAVPDDGKLYIVGVEERTGTKNGKPWTKYQIAASDGTYSSTFDADLAIEAQVACDKKHAVKLFTTPAENPKWNDTLDNIMYPASSLLPTDVI